MMCGPGNPARYRPFTRSCTLMLFVKTRQGEPVTTKAVYLALDINLEGEKELLGLWVAQSESSTFWLSVCSTS